MVQNCCSERCTSAVTRRSCGVRLVLGHAWTGIRVGNTEGYTGVLPTQPPRLRETPRQRSGPRKPLQGAGVGGLGVGIPFAPGPTLACSQGPFPAVTGPPRANPASWPIRRDSATFPGNLVKTAKCHRFVSKRPVIVPVSQNGSGMSPLEIPRFPF